MTLQTDFEDLIDTMETNLQTKGVTDAQFDSATGLMGLVSRILDIPSSPSSSISLTSNKSILSKADGESAILIATITNNGTGVTGEIVLISRDDVVIGLATDNNDGTYTYEYESEGVGDISFTATNGSITSNVYIIEDCTRYDTTEYTTRQDVQWAMPTGDFEVSGDFYHTSNSDSFPQLYIGTELSVNNISFGKIYYKKYGAEFKKNNSQLALLKTNADLSDNTYHTTKLTRVGDLYTVICDNGETLTYSNNTILPTYLFIIYVPQSKIKNIKIKPLKSLSLTSSASVLSYTDSDTCTLTATHSKGCGEVVKLYNASNDSLFGVMTDNRDGTYTYNYTSQGVGDIGFYAKSGMLVSETYTIQDCELYDSTTYQASHDYNLQLSSTHYSLEFDILKKNTNSGTTGGVIIGTSDSYFMVGSGSSGNYNISYWGNGVTFTNMTTLTQNSWESVKIIVNGTSANIIINGITYSVTGIGADTSKLYQVQCNTSNLNIRNMKIKPL